MNYHHAADSILNSKLINVCLEDSREYVFMEVESVFMLYINSEKLFWAEIQ